MSCTMLQATDEIMKIFKDSWDTTGFRAAYPDKKFDKPTARESWARIHIQHATGGQRTLSGAEGTRKFGREGIVTVQVFTPNGNGLLDSYPLVNMLVNTYEVAKAPFGIWFRNVRALEVGKDGDWQQTNVIAEFSYDEIK